MMNAKIITCWFVSLFVLTVLVVNITGCAEATAAIQPLAKSGVSKSTQPGSRHHKKQARHTGSTRVSQKSSKGSGDLWDRVAHGFQIPYSAQNPRIQSQINWFLQNQKYLNNTTERASPYMYLVYEQIQKRNLPMELVLLPVVESAYHPLAYSGAGASGLWQLMPGTARKFGVKHNAYYDGRRDIFASTSAALDYLIYLQNYFEGDWLLALAAYDSGEGTVQRAIQRNARLGKETDYWSLSLPGETRAYIPRILALADIIKHRDSYPVHLPRIDDEPYLGQVDAGGQIKLKDAADMAGIHLAELKRLNPGYKKTTTDPNGTHKLLLPVEKIDAFKEKLASPTVLAQASVEDDDHDDEPSAPVSAPKQQRLVHTIKSGESLSHIAKKHHVTVKQLQVWNKLAQNQTLKPGKKLVILKKPMAMAKNTGQKKKRIATKKSKAAAAHYVVRQGDTLEKIAKKSGVKLADLKKWNNVSNVKRLKPGQKLVLRG